MGSQSVSKLKKAHDSAPDSQTYGTFLRFWWFDGTIEKSLHVIWRLRSGNQWNCGHTAAFKNQHLDNMLIIWRAILDSLVDLENCLEACHLSRNFSTLQIEKNSDLKPTEPGFANRLISGTLGCRVLDWFWLVLNMKMQAEWMTKSPVRSCSTVRRVANFSQAVSPVSATKKALSKLQASRVQ